MQYDEQLQLYTMTTLPVVKQARFYFWNEVSPTYAWHIFGIESLIRMAIRQAIALMETENEIPS